MLCAFILLFQVLVICLKKITSKLRFSFWTLNTESGSTVSNNRCTVTRAFECWLLSYSLLRLTSKYSYVKTRSRDVVGQICSQCYAEARNEWRVPSLFAPGQHRSEEISQRWRPVGDTGSDWIRPESNPLPLAPLAVSKAVVTRNFRAFA